jgi:hypothetical protein
MDWMPMVRRPKNAKIHGRMMPRPGFMQRRVNVITSIDAEMIVFEK